MGSFGLFLLLFRTSSLLISMMPWLQWKKKLRGSESYGVLPGALYSLLAYSLFLLACSCSCLRLTSSLNAMVTKRKEIHGLWKLWCYAGCSGWRPFGPPNLYWLRIQLRSSLDFEGSFSKPRRRRQRERHQTKGLMSKSIAVHVCLESLYISLLSSTKQQRSMYFGERELQWLSFGIFRN